MRTITSTLAAAGSMAALATPALAAPAPPASPQTVRGQLITRQPHTLARGTRVAASHIISQRTFVDASHGFALVDRDQAQYPAATADGGRSWRTDGPALHVDAAQGPLAVTSIGALNRRTIFAYGAGNVVDATSDGGRHWRRALWSDGSPMAVVGSAQGHLVAFVDSFGSRGDRGPTWQYVSRDGGRTWHLTTVTGGG